MNITPLHDWNLTSQQAIALQKELAGQVVDDFHLPLSAIRTIAGVDVSVKDDVSTAAIVILSFPDFMVIESARAKLPTPFPYIPGLLSFREIPVILRAFEEIQTTPDVLMVDGMGRIHPRKLGIACHLGLWLNLPSLGVGKTPFIGTHAPLSPDKGAMSQIVYQDEVLGVALRTRADVKPLYISVGHKLDLDSAVAITLACITKYRQPEPIRHAHNTAGRADES
ncbi:MAG: deoxyribonuclease V [Anaerolineae bacterium]|jgi:deoxyribonuclease V|nr:deoxyribonuclease V [Anaerolineae bacterium]